MPEDKHLKAKKLQCGRELTRASIWRDLIIPDLINSLNHGPEIQAKKIQNTLRDQAKLIKQFRDSAHRFITALTTVLNFDSADSRRNLGICSAKYTASHTQFTLSVTVLRKQMNTVRETLRTNLDSLNSIIERPLSNNDDKDLDHKRAQAAIDISKIIPPRSRENRFARPPDKYPLGTTARTDHELQFSRARQYIHQYGPLLTSLDTNAAEIAQLAQPKKSIKKINQKKTRTQKTKKIKKTKRKKQKTKEKENKRNPTELFKMPKSNKVISKRCPLLISNGHDLYKI